MNMFLDKLLMWIEPHLPQGQGVWISDLRTEAQHIPSSFVRLRFLWSGLLAACGQILHVRFGVRRVGQTLLGVALFLFCLVLSLSASAIQNDVVRTVLLSAMLLYGVSGGLALLNLRLMRRFTAICSGSFLVLWTAAGLNILPNIDAPTIWFHGFLLEVSIFMAVLYVAASYLVWVERADHA